MASEPQRMEQSELEYIFNSLKPKQAISVWFNSAVRSADSWTELQVGRKSKSKKYNLEKISLTNPKNPKGSKYYLYNRQGRISFAMGDMGTSLIAIKTNEIYESEGLKYMRDGDVRIINVGDRDYRVTKVMPEKGDTFNPYYHVRLNLSGITAEIVKQGSTWTYYTNARLQPLLNQKFKNPMAALEDIKEKESRGEFGTGDKLAESFEAEQKFRHKTTGEIATQISLLDMKNWEKLDAESFGADSSETFVFNVADVSGESDDVFTYFIKADNEVEAEEKLHYEVSQDYPDMKFDFMLDGSFGAESFSADHPKFDPQKADRNKDGKISSWERTVGNEVAKSMAAEDVTWMIDSSKYEGISEDRVWKQYSTGLLSDYVYDYNEADQNLVADAPKILYGYKKQMDVLTTLDEKIRNGESHADLMKALEQGLGLPETWKEMGAESFSADTISVKGEAFYPSNGLPFKGAGYTLYVLGECCVRAHQNSRNYHFCPTCGLSQQLARKMINEDIIFLNDKLMGYSAESFSADERKFVEVLVEYNLPGDPEYIYDLLEGANMKIIEMKDYYGAESFSADDQTRHYKNLGIGAALVAGLAYWFKR